MVKTLSILFLFVITFRLSAQEYFIIEGIIKDSATHEPLAFATLAIEPINKGLVSDANGRFSYSIPKGEYTLQASFIGYKTLSKQVLVAKNKVIDFYLVSISINVDDVTILAQKADENIHSLDVGTVEINSKEITKLPTLMGEPDLINVFRLTPGVQSVGEGNPGLYIRGGDAGQNLFLLDQMPLYNPSHLLGFFPVFNSDIIDNALLIKGGIPAQYGGRTSSVIDIAMKEGQSDRMSGSGSIGLLSSDLTLESTLNKGKGSIIVSGRRTYMEAVKALSKPFIKSGNNFFNKTNYYFYDGSVKLRYNLGSKTRIYITAFGGSDKYKLTDNDYNVSNQMVWTNAVASVKLSHTFTEKLFVNLISGKTLYKFNIDAAFNEYAFNIFSGIDDWNNAMDFTYLRKPGLPIKFGLAYTKHQLTPNKIDINAGDVNFNTSSLYHSNEMSAYANADIEILPRLTLSSGLRTTYFQHIGPYTYYIKNEFDQISDSISYAKNQPVKSYLTFDPNVKWVYVLNEKASIKGSVSLTHQFIHLASVGTVSLPTDVWLPSTNFIEPQKVLQVTSGYFRNFMENTLETSAELYYKNMQNQIDFLNGVLDNFDNTQLEENMIVGKGQAFGIEFFIKKRVGNTSGWISYTLSKTLRQFDEINKGNYFPAKYDRVHDFSFTMNHQINKHWDISAIFVYATGSALTLPAGRYLIQGNVANHYTNVNSFRMPPYHRLDVSANYRFERKGRLESWLNFSIYNIYNRANPYFVYFQVKGDLDHYSLSVKPKQISLFPILPAVTWTFKF